MEVKNMTEKEKRKGRGLLAQKVSVFFETHEMLLIPTVFEVNMLITLAICVISKKIACVMGDPNAMYVISMIILFTVVIAGMVFVYRSDKAGHKPEEKVKNSNTSDKTE